MANAPSLAAHGVCNPKHPLSATHPRILRAVLHIAFMRCVAALSPPDFRRMLVDTMCFLRRCTCASCNRDCRLSTLARASDARATAPTPSRAPARAFAVIRPTFHCQLPEHVPSHPYPITNSFCLATYSAVLTSLIQVL
ncbi:hypothetical protein B0H13DRAFT_2309632 [Mycena leptocephala]|nr:hypothetical protein B0H13DRAFT_2309632 [Mycena leptocephala]